MTSIGAGLRNDIAHATVINLEMPAIGTRKRSTLVREVAQVSTRMAAPRSNLPRSGDAAGERVVISAADGYQITATRFEPAGPTRARLIVAGAIGVPQQFYRRFAAVAAAQGYSTMTLDYRGIGLSKPATLRGFRMDTIDWGRMDLAAAVDAMAQPGVPLYTVTHSFGGQAFGLLPNHAKVAAVFAFGTGAGWFGWMPRSERMKVWAMCHVLGPALTRWRGYLPWSLVGRGEDLPLDVYRQWRRWCRHPRYFFDDPAMQDALAGYERVRIAMMAANAIDDRWSPPASRNAFMAGYKNAPVQTLDIHPHRYGLQSIGHMGYFRRDAQPLWESALAWLEFDRVLAVGA